MVDPFPPGRIRPSRDMQRFLVVRTGALGDIIHGLPVAAALKKAYPYLRVDWIAETHYADLLRCVPFLDDVITVSFKAGAASLADTRIRGRWKETVRTVRRTAYSATIDLQGLIRSGMISWMSGAPLRIGFPREHVRELPNCLFTNIRPGRIPVRRHVIDRNLALLHPLGIIPGRRSFKYRIPAQAEETVGRYMHSAAQDGSMPRIAIHPVTGWRTKEWQPDRFAEIARRLIKVHGARVFLLWGPGEKDRVAGIRDRMETPAHLVPAMGLPELLSFLKRCDLFVGGDSGPMHMASSLGIPVVALFGPTDPVRNGPILGRARVVRGHAPCGPCYRRRCPRSECMDAISVEDVWGPLTTLLTEVYTRSAMHGAGA
jgi:heptosyltransferase-1